MEAAGPALRYGFLGCGMMGQEHLRNLSLLTSSRARVVAIFEPDEQMAAISLALADPGAELVGSVEALVAHPAVDAIVIASPNHRHCEQLQMVVRHLHKAVLVEKPVCTNLEDVHVLRRLTTSASIVWTAMEYRFMPAISTFLRLAHDSTTTGEIVSVSIREHRFPFLDKVGNWNRFNKNTGGTMVEKCCHFFDLMRLIMQDEPLRVFASGGQNCNHLDERIDGETPDIGQCLYLQCAPPSLPIADKLTLSLSLSLSLSLFFFSDSRQRLCGCRLSSEPPSDARPVHVCRGLAVPGRTLRRGPQGQDRSQSARTCKILAGAPG